MKFYLEHNERIKCWKIFDMRNHQETEEALCLMSISDSLMDRFLAGILLQNGAIELEEIVHSPKKGRP
jgi:hypothetical protein